MEAFIIITCLIIGTLVMLFGWRSHNKTAITSGKDSTEKSDALALSKKTVAPSIVESATKPPSSSAQPALTEQELKAAELLLLNGLRLNPPQAADGDSSWFADFNKKHPLTWCSKSLKGGSLTSLKAQIENWKQLGVRFASIPTSDPEKRAIHLVFRGHIRERVGPPQREVALSQLISQGSSCLIQRINVEGNSAQGMDAIIELNTTRSLRTSCKQAAAQPRIWDLDFATLTANTNNNWADLWTGTDDHGKYIVRNPLFSGRTSSGWGGGERLIVELTTKTAVVRKISIGEWGSGRYRSYKQCNHPNAIREDCLALYQLHHQIIWEQVKAEFIRYNADLFEEVGFPIFLDKSFSTIFEENVSDYQRKGYTKLPSVLSSLENMKVKGYGDLVDKCHTTNQQPPSFSQYCENIHHILAYTEEQAKEDDCRIEQNEAMLGDWCDDYDSDWDEPINRF